MKNTGPVSTQYSRLSIATLILWIIKWLFIVSSKSVFTDKCYKIFIIEIFILHTRFTLIWVTLLLNLILNFLKLFLHFSVEIAVVKKGYGNNNLYMDICIL